MKRQGGNRFGLVYRTMLCQVMREYSGLGDFRKLKAHEIKFLYDGLRAELERGP